MVDNVFGNYAWESLTVIMVGNYLSLTHVDNLKDPKGPPTHVGVVEVAWRRPWC